MTSIWEYMTQIERYEAYHDLKDKLRRRNLQIKDLRKEIVLYRERLDVDILLELDNA